MCLAIPAKIVSIEDTTAQLDMAGNSVQADVSMVPDAVIGDYVIVHAGFAIQIYDKQRAEETLETLREYATIYGQGEEQ